MCNPAGMTDDKECIWQEPGAREWLYVIYVQGREIDRWG